MPIPPPPPEWAPQDTIWIGWPSDETLWEADLAPAREEVAALVRAILDSGQRVDLVAGSEQAHQAARDMLGDRDTLRLHRMAMGDIWLRDTGPVFRTQDGALHATRFRFNGWGGKYDLPGDDQIGDHIARAGGAATTHHDFVLEGGAIDWNGTGAVITTRQCLLNPNRNPAWSQTDAQTALRTALGLAHVIWLEDGLLNDHTDGHVDNIARFIGPRKIACQTPFGEDDPNAGTLRRIEADLRAARDPHGEPYEIVTLLSPGLVRDGDTPVPASHMNFLITNHLVVVPIYDTPSAEPAIAALRPHFPDREVIGLPTRHILTGGGAFHCISQQQPALTGATR